MPCGRGKSVNVIFGKKGPTNGQKEEKPKRRRCGETVLKKKDGRDGKKTKSR